MKKAIMIFFLALAGASASVYAQKTAVVTSDKTGWHKIGETTVDFQRDKDEISVIGANKFASIKFKVTEAAIQLISLEVYYESGDNQNVAVNFPIKPQGESRVIDLNGGERSIKKVVFVYKTIANVKNEKARVELWGLKTNDDKK